MPVQLLLHPALVRPGDLIAAGPRVADEGVGAGELDDQGAGLGAVIILWDSNEVHHGVWADALVDVVDAAFDGWPVHPDAAEAADDRGVEGGGFELLENLLA